MLLSKAITGFILSRTAEGYSTRTIILFKGHLQQLIDWLGDQEVGEIGTEDLRRFFAYLRTEYKPRGPWAKHGNGRLSESSIHNAWVAVRSFFRWAEDDLKIQRPDLGIPNPKVDPPDINPYTEDEVRRMLKACDESRLSSGRRAAFRMRCYWRDRNRLIIMLLLDTGLRAGELCRLKVRDVNLETGVLTIERFGSGKKTKGRAVTVCSRVRKALWQYLIQREQSNLDSSVFVSKSNQPLQYDALRQLIDDVANRAGVSDAHAHRFRHTFAIQYLRNGGDVFTLQRILGHSTLEMVNRYLKIAMVDVQEAHRKASPVDRWHL